MSIASDLRSAADNAVSSAVTQGRHGLATAQAQLNDVTGQANEFYDRTRENVADIAEKATEAVSDLRASAEKAIDVDAIRSAVEPYLTPYLAQAQGYATVVGQRAEELYAELVKDPRVAQLIDAARPVVETVQVRVIRPVLEVTGLGSTTTRRQGSRSSASRPSPRKAATTRPARKAPAKKAAGRPAAKSTATKSTATKSAATKSTAAKSTAAKSTTAKSTPSKSTARKPATRKTDS